MQIKSCVWKEPCSGPLAPPSGYFRQLLLGTALWPTCRVPVCPKYLPPLQLGWNSPVHQPRPSGPWSKWFCCYLFFFVFHSLIYVFGTGDASSGPWGCAWRASTPWQLGTALQAASLFLKLHGQECLFLPSWRPSLKASSNPFLPIFSPSIHRWSTSRFGFPCPGCLYWQLPAGPRAPRWTLCPSPYCTWV